MTDRMAKFWSLTLLSLSQAIIDVKKQSFYRIKLKSVNNAVREIERFDIQSKTSQKKTVSDMPSYMSINDFKPVSSVYSSVKLHEDDFITNRHQTRKQRIHEMSKAQNNICALQDWMVAKKAQTIPVQQYDIAQFAKKEICTYSQIAIQSIKSYSFEQFCAKSLKRSTNFLFHKGKNKLQHRKDTISESLTYLPDGKVQIALDLFVLLLKVGQQQNDEYPIVYTIWKFIHIIFDEDQSIKQQAYFQVIKQWSNKKKIYIQLLACMSSAIAPTAALYLPLLNFIYNESMQPALAQFKPFYNYIFFNLIKNFSSPKQAPLSLFEIYCTANLKKIPILINFPRQNIFFIESYSTVEQLLQQLIQLYGLNKKTQYLLNIQNYLLISGPILDGLNKNRQNINEYEAWQKFMNFKGYQASIVIKNMMEIYTCEANFIIMFNYIINQYKRGLYSVSNQIAFEIGGLIIASQIQLQDYYEFNLAKYLPRNKYSKGLSQAKKEKIQEYIIEQYLKFEGTKKQARKLVVQKLSKSLAFLTHFFFCTIFYNDLQYTQSWVGIKPQSILIIEPQNGRVSLQVDYEDIRKWGKSASQLCLQIDGVGDLHIQSKALEVLVSIFTNYIKFLSEKLKKL